MRRFPLSSQPQVNKQTIKATLYNERILIPAVFHVVEALKKHKKSKIFKYTTVNKLFRLINNSQRKYKGNKCLISVWKSDEKLLIFAFLISPSKSICLRSNINYSTQCFITR